MSKLPENVSRGFAVGFVGQLWCRVISKVFVFPVHSDKSNPFSISFVVRNTLKARWCISLLASVLTILCFGGYSQITTSIVQCFPSLDVVSLPYVAIFEAENFSMHRNFTTLSIDPVSTNGIKTLRTSAPVRVPFPLREPLKINLIYNCKLSSRKRDQAIGCFRAGFLSDQVHGRLRERRTARL